MNWARKQNKMTQFRFEITPRDYLIVPAEVAAEYFPENACVAMLRTGELWILPIRGAASGGLLMKQRNLRGDRSVLVWEALGERYQPGGCEGVWDAENGAMRIKLSESR